MRMLQSDRRRKISYPGTLCVRTKRQIPEDNSVRAIFRKKKFNTKKINGNTHLVEFQGGLILLKQQGHSLSVPMR